MDVLSLIVPAVKLAFAVLFVGIFFFVIYKGIFAGRTNWKFALKYGLFKKEVSDEIVNLCLKAIEEGKTASDLAKEQMIAKKYTLSQAKELIYVYNMVNKNTGGL